MDFEILPYLSDSEKARLGAQGRCDSVIPRYVLSSRSASMEDSINALPATALFLVRPTSTRNCSALFRSPAFPLIRSVSVGLVVTLIGQGGSPEAWRRT